MVNTQSIVDGIKKDLEKLADTDRKKYGEKSYPTKMKIIGVKVPVQRNIVKQFSKEIKNLEKEDVIKIAVALINTNIFECQQVVYEAIANDKKIISALNFKDIQDISKNLDNWLSVDTFASLIVGPVWRDNRVSDTIIQNWAKSENFWMRRVAVVATVALNQKARGGAGDPKRTLDICGIVAGDTEDMVIKSLSWALRELAKRDVKPVQDFIKEYEKILSPKIKREVEKKIETGKK